jgi:heme/copper-type cytochrome/quinol oxidase subunit 2
MDPQQQQIQAMHMMAAILPMIFLFWLVIMAFLVFCFWRVFTKAGMSGPLSLLMLVPAVGPLVVICILAFGEWKVVPAPPYGGYPPPYPPSYPPQPPTV